MWCQLLLTIYMWVGSSSKSIDSESLFVGLIPYSFVPSRWRMKSLNHKMELLVTRKLRVALCYSDVAFSRQKQNVVAFLSDHACRL